MADEITFGFITGYTLEYGVYQPDGTVRTAAGTSLPEEGATGYYHADDGSIIALDFVIVTDNATGNVVGQGQYQPDVTSSSIELELDDIDADLTLIKGKLDVIKTSLNKVKNDYPEPLELPRPIVGV